MAIVPCRGLDCKFSDLGVLLVGIFDWLLGLAGLVAMLFLIWGGIQMLKGWIEEEPEGAFKEGMLTVRRAIWGLVLVAGAYLIVNTLLTGILGVEGGLDALFKRAFP